MKIMPHDRQAATFLRSIKAKGSHDEIAALIYDLF